MSLPELYLVESALLLAETLNFSRAAARRRVTQPAFSKQIGHLESIVGVQLFDRDRQTVRLTEAGRTFIDGARETLSSAERMVQSTRSTSYGATTTLNIGKCAFVDPFFVSIIQAIRLPLFPNLRIKFWSHYSHELISQLSTGEFDLALLTDTPATSHLTTSTLARTPLYVAMLLGDKLASKRSISIEDLRDRIWVVYARHTNPARYDSLLQLADKHAVRAMDILQVVTAEEAGSFVLEQGALALLTPAAAWRIAHGGITIRPLAEERARMVTTLAARSNNTSSLINKFVRAVSTRLKEVKHRPQATQLALPL